MQHDFFLISEINKTAKQVKLIRFYTYSKIMYT